MERRECEDKRSEPSVSDPHFEMRWLPYHFRWKSETGFSDFKEIFPETVTATSVRSMVLEVMARTEVFNAFKRGRAAIMKVTGNGVEVA